MRIKHARTVSRIIFQIKPHTNISQVDKLDIANTTVQNNVTSLPTSSVEYAAMQDIWQEIAQIVNVVAMPVIMFREDLMDHNGDLVAVMLSTARWRYVFLLI